MYDLSALAAGSILASLILYVLSGGADFGGGVWDLLSRGPRGPAQRLLIAHAIGPIWETNHIWVVVAVVILFTGFPQAFALISTALFLPVTLMLAGIVLRGAAFAFHSYNLHDEGGRMSRWGAVFAGASLLTPVLLGVVIGAVSSGDIRAHETVAFGASFGGFHFRFPWDSSPCRSFPILHGIPDSRTGDTGLREDFRGPCGLPWSSQCDVRRPADARLDARSLPRPAENDWSADSFSCRHCGARRPRPSAPLLSRRPDLCTRRRRDPRDGGGAIPFIVRPTTIPAAASSHAALRLILIALAAGDSSFRPLSCCLGIQEGRSGAPANRNGAKIFSAWSGYSFRAG